MSGQQNVMELHGEAGTTIKITSGDTAKAFIHADNISTMLSSNKVIQSLLITVEDADIRIAFTATPTQAGLGHVIGAGSSIRITNPRSIANLKYINKTNGLNAVIQVTAEFNQ